MNWHKDVSPRREHEVITTLIIIPRPHPSISQRSATCGNAGQWFTREVWKFDDRDETGCVEVRCMRRGEREEVRGIMFKGLDQRAGYVEVRCCGLKAWWLTLEERRPTIS